MYVEDGAYFSFPQINEAEGFEDSITAAMKSQPYFSEVLTRGIVFIEVDNPYVGLMCFIAIGMMKVSSCELIVYARTKCKERSGDRNVLLWRLYLLLDFSFWCGA